MDGGYWKSGKACSFTVIAWRFSVLSVNEQSVINAWVAIKTIVGEFDDVARKAIPFADRESVYKNKMPPANWVFGLGNMKVSTGKYLIYTKE